MEENIILMSHGLLFQIPGSWVWLFKHYMEFVFPFTKIQLRSGCIHLSPCTTAMQQPEKQWHERFQKGREYRSKNSFSKGTLSVLDFHNFAPPRNAVLVSSDPTVPVTLGIRRWGYRTWFCTVSTLDPDSKMKTNHMTLNTSHIKLRRSFFNSLIYHLSWFKSRWVALVPATIAAVTWKSSHHNPGTLHLCRQGMCAQMFRGMHSQSHHLSHIPGSSEILWMIWFDNRYFRLQPYADQTLVQCHL